MYNLTLNETTMTKNLDISRFQTYIRSLTPDKVLCLPEPDYDIRCILERRAHPEYDFIRFYLSGDWGKLRCALFVKTETDQPVLLLIENTCPPKWAVAFRALFNKLARIGTKITENDLISQK